MLMLLDLPTSLLTRILDLLDPLSLIFVQATCKGLYELSAEEASLCRWKQACLRTLGAPLFSLHSFFSRQQKGILSSRSRPSVTQDIGASFSLTSDLTTIEPLLEACSPRQEKSLAERRHRSVGAGESWDRQVLFWQHLYDSALRPTHVQWWRAGSSILQRNHLSSPLDEDLVRTEQLLPSNSIRGSLELEDPSVVCLEILRRTGHSATLFGSWLVIIAGLSRESEALMDVVLIDVSTLAIWQPSIECYGNSPLPQTRLRHAVAVIRAPSSLAPEFASPGDQLLFMYGGYNLEGEVHGDAESFFLTFKDNGTRAVFSCAASVMTGHPPSPRFHHSMCAFADGSKVVLYGGEGIDLSDWCEPHEVAALAASSSRGEPIEHLRGEYRDDPTSRCAGTGTVSSLDLVTAAADCGEVTDRTPAGDLDLHLSLAAPFAFNCSSNATTGTLPSNAVPAPTTAASVAFVAAVHRASSVRTQRQRAASVSLGAALHQQQQREQERSQGQRQVCRYAVVYVLDVPSMRWSRVPTGGCSPGVRYLHLAAVHSMPGSASEQLIVFGGYTSSFSELESMQPYSLDLRSMSWRSGPGGPQAAGAFLPPPRNRAGVCKVGSDTLLLLEGCMYDTRNYMRDVHALHLPSLTWRAVAAHGEATVGPCAGLTADGLLAVGGCKLGNLGIYPVPRADPLLLGHWPVGDHVASTATPETDEACAADVEPAAAAAVAAADGGCGREHSRFPAEQRTVTYPAETFCMAISTAIKMQRGLLQGMCDNEGMRVEGDSASSGRCSSDRPAVSKRQRSVDTWEGCSVADSLIEKEQEMDLAVNLNARGVVRRSLRHRPAR